MANPTWYHHNQSLTNKNTSLVCNKVTFLDNANNVFFFDHVNVKPGSSINGMRFIANMNQDPGMKDWFRTQSFEDFCEGVRDLCSGWVQSGVGIESVVQNYVPFTLAAALDNSEQRIIYMHEGYGQYNIDAFHSVIEDTTLTSSEKISQLKHMQVYGHHYVLGHQLNEAIKQNVPYKIQGGLYHYSFSTIDLIFSNLNDITVYATKLNNTYEMSTATAAITLTEVGVSLYFAAKAMQLANTNLNNKVVKILGFEVNKTNALLSNQWPSWWLNINLPSAAYRDTNDSIFDIIQKAKSGDINSQNTLRIEAQNCSEGTSQYNTKICDIIIMLTSQNGVIQSNTFHNKDTLIVSENLFSEQGLINAMLAETSARYIAYQNSENGSLLVYLFSPNRNEQHVHTHRQLHPFLEGYNFVGAGYIEVFDQSATFDSTTMYREYGYDRPSDPSVQRKILERISHLFQQFYGS
ncbi:MAG TPA: hypothetical protein PKB05_01410 [Oligoflexia bacterium]|nr:hypothetical protein [Oligoflexia bacterium]